MRNIIDFIKESLVLEKRGVFDGAAEIAECIYDIIFVDGHSSDTVEISLDDLESKAKDLGLRLQNIFFKSIVIDISTKHSGDYIAGNFSISDSIYNYIDDLFEEISIGILYDPDTIPGKSDVVDTLVHELTHAYTEWNLRLKGMTMSPGKSNSVKSADYYDQVTPEIDDNNINDKNIGSHFFYLTYGHEKNAFFASIANKARKYNSYAIAIEELKKDKAFNEYLNVFSICKLKQKDLEKKKQKKEEIREKKLRGEKLTEEDLKEPEKLLDSDLDKSILDAWKKLNKFNYTKYNEADNKTREEIDDKIWKTIINDACKSYKKLKNIIKKATEK